MRARTIPCIAASLLLAACSDLAPTGTADAKVARPGAVQLQIADAAVHRYRVTLENLTTGQVFSPGVMATHTKDASLWNVGAFASEGVRLIAEDGNEAMALAALSGASGVFDVVHIATPTNRIGGGAPLPNPQSFEISAGGNANRLSLAVMLICTNDGFTGVSSVKLPGGFKAESHDVGAYDAGTELNTESNADIVDPCFGAGPVPLPGDGNGRIATSGVIRMHPNIQGIGDLSVPLHGWSGPVARITVQRIK